MVVTIKGGAVKLIYTGDQNSELVFCTVFVNNKRQKYLGRTEVNKSGVSKCTSDRFSEPDGSTSAADVEPLSLVCCELRYTHADASTTALPLVDDCSKKQAFNNNKKKKNTQKKKKQAFSITKTVTSAPALVAKCGYGRQHKYSCHKEEVQREYV